jgi:DNA-binding beta-propeller fold protein YncE
MVEFKVLNMFQSLLLILHLFGMVIGAGAAFTSDRLFFASIKNRIISRDEFSSLEKLSYMVWFGLLLSVISGVGLFALSIDSFSSSEKFISKTIIVAIIIANGLLFHFVHLPFFKRNIGKHIATKANPITFSNIPVILLSGAVSVTSWVTVIVLGGLRSLPVSSLLIFFIYFSCILMGFLTVWFIFRSYIHISLRKIFINIAVFLGILAIGFGACFIIFSYGKTADPKPQQENKNIFTGTFSLEEVAQHNTDSDCWLVIDDKVFDATEASRVHPAMFNCGQDVSDNYHKNHGTGIRDKMMKFYIGDIGDKKSTEQTSVSPKKNIELKPYRELYVTEGSWNPRELMFVVEKDAENLLAIDGTTHKPIGRIHDVGFQPHTSVFSSDAKYMYIISRDGWLTKIDIKTLHPVISVEVGVNSRGTAITDNNKYIAIGNYEPGNLIILDADSMKILKTIPLITKMDGKDVESRAGAVVESGNRIVVALKDTNSVWSVDTDKPDFPVTNKFEDIGKNVPALHDAFLTPNGKYYIVASQGSKTAWVLDLETMKQIAEVQTGETPHTGPGAAWGDYIYVPALGEGLITVIDTKTWKPAKYIKTGGPGLFVRSYSKDPSYPYVWADTAFGDHKDEIYVIDARINEIVKTIIPVKGESSWHPEFTYDGKFVYVVSQSANEVEVYDAHTFELVKRIKSDTPSAISNVGLRIEEPGL